MNELIDKKSIQCIGIIPIIVNDKVLYLAIIDKLISADSRFTEKDLSSIGKFKKSIEKKIRPYFLAREKIDKQRSEMRNIIDGYAHFARNPLTVIGGFAERLIKNQSQVEEYAKIIVSEASIAEKNFNFLITLSLLLVDDLEEKNISLNDIMSLFLEDERYEKKFDQAILNEAAETYPESIKMLLEELKKYIETGSKKNEKLSISAVRESFNIIITIYGSALQSFKKNDPQPRLFNYIAELINCRFEILDGCCKVSISGRYIN